MVQFLGKYMIIRYVDPKGKSPSKVRNPAWNIWLEYGISDGLHASHVV